MRGITPTPAESVCWLSFWRLLLNQMINSHEEQENRGPG